MVRPVTRFPDWQLRFARFVSERFGRPFQWGAMDCTIFAADAVEAITGEIVYPELRGRQSAREALRAVRDAGGVRALATGVLGDPVGVAFARIGDVVVIPAGKREALAVCNGATVLAPGPSGVSVLPVSVARAAWRVG